jgi:hypothetical protein
MRLKARLSPENYEFHMANTELLDGRMAYVIDVVPRRRDERLFEGQIWIDAQDYALARVEGKPAKNPSFWTTSVHFVHTYQKSGPFWFPASTERRSNPILYFGRYTEFIIRRCFMPYALLFFAVFDLTKVVFFLAAIGANLVWLISLYSYCAFAFTKGSPISESTVPAETSA